MSDRPAALRLRSAARRNRSLGLGLRVVIAALLVIFSAFPILWMISASLNPTGSLATQSLIPANPGLGNYQTLIASGEFPFWTWFGNSLKVALTTSGLSLAITTIAAYAFSRFRFRGRQALLRGILLLQVFPALLALVAIFLMISQIGEVIPFLDLDTHGSLILVYLGKVEGASDWQIFTRLILPLLRPILIVIAIINYIGTYGEFVLARVLLRSNETYTLMVGLQVFAGAQFQQRWGVFAAGALLGALPIMILYLTLQDQIVGGLTQGAVKG